MQVVGRVVLNTFLRSHPERSNAKVPLETWHRVVKAARWQTPADVKTTYRHASVFKGGRVVFNIAGNSFRMVAMIDYQRGSGARPLVRNPHRVQQNQRGGSMTHPKVIKSDAEHTAALARLDELMAAHPEPGTPEADELELLSILVERYEDERFPLDLPDPVAAIRVRMQEEGLRPRDLAPYLGGANKVSEVLARKRPLTLKMIRALHEGLGISAEVLLRESDGRLPDRGTVEVGRFPWQEMAKRGWLEGLGVAPEAIKDVEEELYDRFFGKFATLVRSAFYRHPPHVRAGVKMDAYALLAWTVRSALRAEAEPLTVAYRPEALDEDFPRRLVQLSYLDAGPRLAREFLAKAGVHLIVERHLPKTRVDGTALLLPHGTPVVALSLRHDRLDHFWFCLLHELAHVRLHLKPGDEENQEWFVDDFDVSATEDVEEEADQWALDRLVPPEDWDGDIKYRERPCDIIEAAERLRISPAIIAGRVRWETREYRRLSRLVGHGEARRHFPEVDWK